VSNFSHVFISRPQPSGEELAAMLAPLGLQPVVQPAFSYLPLDARAQQATEFSELEAAGPADMVLFTSPRSVAHGLAQISPAVLMTARVAAIGPASAKALADAGIRVNVTPRQGYTSEALLAALARETSPASTLRRRAFIIAAPGGRKKLLSGLRGAGWQVRMIMVYKPEAADLDKSALAALAEASEVLSVWTSANAMKALSHRLSPATWFRICQGEWLVISDRLKRLARAYGPAEIHLASGPDNGSLFNAIRNLL
jgi:uroporphyrinogen-III synthase